MGSPIEYMEYSFREYLDAKRSVDDRALNRVVWEALSKALSAIAVERPVRVLEVGAGIGAMVQRATELEILKRADYTLLDADAGLLSWARSTLVRWGDRRKLQVTEEAGGALQLRGSAIDIVVHTRHCDILEYLAEKDPRPEFDLLIAAAFLDLVDVRSLLPRLWTLAARPGYFWFPINFDGETIFLPEHELDDEILRLYHRSMDTHQRGGTSAGDSKTGRHLFENVSLSGARLIASGSSDWVVHPVDGAYPAKEEYFLRYILNTIWNELRINSELRTSKLESWVAERQSQIDAHELTYIAHQLDFFGRV